MVENLNTYGTACLLACQERYCYLHMIFSALPRIQKRQINWLGDTEYTPVIIVIKQWILPATIFAEFHSAKAARLAFISQMSNLCTTVFEKMFWYSSYISFLDLTMKKYHSASFEYLKKNYVEWNLAKIWFSNLFELMVPAPLKRKINMVMWNIYCQHGSIFFATTQSVKHHR